MSSVKVDIRQFDKLVKQLDEMPEMVMVDAERFFTSKTPIRSGNARKNTDLKNRTTILADYAYADRLDNGWSRQAPNGMTDPTIEFIERKINEAVRKL